MLGIRLTEAGMFGSSLYGTLSVIDHYVRKSAHFIEYALLAVLVFRALRIDLKTKKSVCLQLHGHSVLFMPQQMNCINSLFREEAAR